MELVGPYLVDAKASSPKLVAEANARKTPPMIGSTYSRPAGRSRRSWVRAWRALCAGTWDARSASLWCERDREVVDLGDWA